ncbi:GntG family PLP-dependent aldolase [Saccharothrix sp. Mg75]|uniref:GntG family PLP-dependent aldolase n=1 Tax=Saccharothrix sp. Mg75 TaxID=3445357 RepID=UPI003EEAC342
MGEGLVKDVGRAGRRIELRSDTFTLPTAEMMAAMAAAPLGDDVYGEDPTVVALEAEAASVLGKPAGCYLPSGTMANLASILVHCPRGTKVIVGEQSDIYVYEAGGASVCGGVVYHPVPNLHDGSLDPDALVAAFPTDPGDPQFALPALLCLENPQNHAGGKVLSQAYLADTAAFAHAHGVPVHVDGARIFNAAAATGVDAADIAAHADSVQFCLSKGLGAPIGSVVVGPEAFVAGVRRVRKMLGGGMRQAGVVAAAGLVGLRDRGRLAEDHATARRLAEGLSAIPGITLDGDADINMVFFRVTAHGWDSTALIGAAREHGIDLAELGPGRIRAVTHLGVDTADVDHAVDVVASILHDSTARSEPAGSPHVRYRADLVG